MARSVSFVIPTLNEEAGIRATLDKIPVERLSHDGWTVEVLIVDGDSRDATRDIAGKWGARVLVEPRRGYGRAYKTGLAAAKGDLVVTGDADGTYPFELAPELLSRLEQEQADFLTTNRFAELEAGAMSPKHKVGNWVLSTTCRILFWTSFHDSQSGMWVLRRAILPQLRLTADGMPFSEEIKIEAFRRRELKALEVGIPYRVRLGEVKLESMRDGWRNLFFLFKKRFGLTRARE